jgi:adenylate cyclase
MVQNLWRNVVLLNVGRAVQQIGAEADDSDEARLQKTLLVASTLMMSIMGILAWGPIYLFSGERLAGIIPISYGILSFISIAIYRLTYHYQLFRFSQLLMSLLLPFLLMVALGGFLNSSAVVLWSLTAPLGALLFTGRRQATVWFGAYLGLVVISGFLEVFARPANNLPPALVTAFFVMNISGVSLVAFVLVHYFVGQKNTALRLLGQEQEKSERLLLNVLPREIATVLKNENRTIADHFDAVSVLFADVVGFTTLSTQLTPSEMVGLLNEVFCYFDSLVEKYDLEKIRTIGDNYMVASGVPRPRPDHAQALARMALDMNAYIVSHPANGRLRLQFRIGMNSGPAVAGVIGQQKFHYDLWGDAVNIASRMESHGVPGKIQITGEMYELLKDEFICEPRGVIEIKGKGEMQTWFLVSVRP